MATITTLGFTIFSTYDGKGVSQAQTDLKNLNNDLNTSNANLSKSASSFFSVSTAAMALGPSLVPLGGAALAAGGALATMGGAGVAAGGLLGLAFAAIMKSTGSAAQDVQASVGNVMTDFGKWGNSIAPLLLGPVEAGVTGIVNSFDKLTPGVEALAPVAERVGVAFMSWVDSSLSQWVTWIGTTGRPILDNLVTVGINLATTFGAMLRAFSPMAVSLSSGLAKISGSLAGWATGGGFVTFMNSVKANGPAISSVLTSFGAAMKNLASAMAGLGPVSLSLTGTLLKMIAAMPPSVIQAIVVAILAWRAAQLAVNAAQSAGVVVEVAKKLADMAVAAATGIATVAELAYAAAELIAMAIGLPIILTIGLIVLAIAALGVAIYFLVTNWSTVWNAIKVATDVVWQWLQATWNTITGFFVTAWQAASGALTAAWGAVWGGIKIAFSAVVDFLEQYWQYLILALGPLGWLIDLATHWGLVWGGIKDAAAAVWTAMQIAWSVFIGTLSAVWTAVSGALVVAWNAVWNALQAAASAVWSFLTTAWNDEITGFEIIWNTVSGALSAAWDAVWNALQVAASAVWDFLSNAWSNFILGLQIIWDTVSSALSTAWSDVWNALQTAASAVWDFLSAAWSTFIQGLESIWDTVSSALSSAWSSVWNAIQTVAEAIWSAIQTAWNALVTAVLDAYNAFAATLSTAWQGFWNTIQTVAAAIWSALQAAWSAFTGAITSAYQAFSSALQSAWSAFWGAIQTAAKAIWDALQTAWSAFTGAIKSAYDSFASTLTSAWSSFWNAIKSTAQSVWDAVTSAFKSFTNGIQSALTTAVAAMKTVWNTVEDIFKVPVHFVIDTVINGGIIKAVNWVIGKLGGSDTAVPTMSLPFADGGFVRGPGTSKSDSIPARLSNGEYVMNASAVRKHGVSKLDAMNKGHMLAGGPNQKLMAGRAKTGGFGFADGGLADSDLETLFEGLVKTVAGAAAGAAGDAAGAVGDVAGAVKSGANAVAKANIPVVSKVASFLGGGAGDVESAADSVKSTLIGWGQSEFDQGTDAIIKLITDKFAKSIPGAGGPIQGLGTGAASHTMSQMLTKVKTDMSKFMFGQQQKQVAAFTAVAGGQIPTAEHQAVIDAAWAAAGVGGSLSDWEVGMNTLITRESAWNPNAINNTDSNAQAGHPSQGLAQCIPSTFEAYHAPGTSNNILDPVANVAASMRYIVATYGGIRNVQQAFGATPLGYASGTSSARQGWHMVDERGGEWINFNGGETVLPHGQTPTVAGGGVVPPITVENHWHGNPTKEAVEYAETDMADKLRAAVMAGVGKRNR